MIQPYPTVYKENVQKVSSPAPIVEQKQVVVEKPIYHDPPVTNLFCFIHSLFLKNYFI